VFFLTFPAILNSDTVCSATLPSEENKAVPRSSGLYRRRVLGKIYGIVKTQNINNNNYYYIYCSNVSRTRDRIPVGARFSAPVKTGPGAHPAPCTMGTGPFPRVENGRGVTLTLTPFSAEV
jgi:hypothetical protein